MEVSFDVFGAEDYSFFQKLASDPDIKNGLESISSNYEYFTKSVLQSVNDNGTISSCEKITCNHEPCGIFHIKFDNNRVEFSYGILPEFRNQGIASIALKRNLESLSVEKRYRFYLKIYPSNNSSLKLAYNSGFQDHSFESGMYSNGKMHFKIELVYPVIFNKPYLDLSENQWIEFEKYFNTGVKLAQMGESKSALTNYKVAYEINPNNALLSYYIAQTYLKLVENSERLNADNVFEGIRYFNEAIFGIENGSSSSERMLSAYLKRGYLKTFYSNQIGGLIDVQKYLEFDRSNQLALTLEREIISKLDY